MNQRLLKRHDSAGSDCMKCLDADIMEADDNDQKATNQDKEFVTDAEMMAESPPPWMIVLQSMMDAQTDKMMNAVGVNTERLDEIEVNVDRNYNERTSKFGRSRSAWTTPRAQRRRISRASKTGCRSWRLAASRRTGTRRRLDGRRPGCRAT